MMNKVVVLFLSLVAGSFQVATAQVFALQHVSDSLNILTLTTDSSVARWQLPHPVYQLQTGDVDGDGKEEALVGVVKSTRFYPEMERRLFIFKNYEGLIRPLWLGSRLSQRGTLCNFRLVDGGRVRSMETNRQGNYAVIEYRWSGFGLAFDHFIETAIDAEEATRLFNQQ